MHMLHVTIGVIYLGVVALRKAFLPILLAIWGICWWLIPADSVFHYGVHALLAGLVVAAVILILETERLRRARRGNRRTVLALRGFGLDVHFPAGVSDVDAGD